MCSNFRDGLLVNVKDLDLTRLGYQDVFEPRDELSSIEKNSFRRIKSSYPSLVKNLLTDDVIDSLGSDGIVSILETLQGQFPEFKYSGRGNSEKINVFAALLRPGVVNKLGKENSIKIFDLKEKPGDRLWPPNYLENLECASIFELLLNSDVITVLGANKVIELLNCSVKN